MASLSESGRIVPAEGRVALRTAYAAGHFAKSLAWTFPDLFLAYYANIRVGLSARDTGLLLFLSMALGALLDVAGAYLLRRAEGSRRRILTIQGVAGGATAVAVLAVFSPVRGPAPFLYLLATLALFRTCYAAYDLAQNALVSLLPEDEADAHHYVVWRQALGTLARLCVAALAFVLIGDGAPRGGEGLVAGGIALLIVGSSGWIMRWAGTGPAFAPPAARRRLAIPTGLPRLLLASAVLGGPLGITARLATFVEGGVFAGHVGAALLFAFVFGSLIGSLALPRRRAAAGRAASGFTALAVLAVLLFLADIRSGPIALAACGAYGIGFGAILALFWREASAVIREHAHRTGVRTDIAAFALLTAMTKLSSAVFGAALGLMLDGFKAGDPTTMIGLGAIAVVGGVGFVLAMAPHGAVAARSE